MKEVILLSHSEPVLNAWPTRPQRIDLSPVSGAGSIAAQVLYVYGGLRQPDPRPIDRALGWRPGHILADFDTACYLMGEGLSCQFFTRETAEDLVKRGLQSIKESYGREWDERHARYFTPARVRQLQQSAEEDIRRKKLYKGLYDEPRRNARPDDVAWHLARGHVISFMTAGREGKLFQQKGLLVPDPDRRSAWLYLVEVDGLPIVPGRAPIETMLRRMRYDCPVIAFWPSKQ